MNSSGSRAKVDAGAPGDGADGVVVSADLNARKAVRHAAHSFTRAEQRWSERRQRGLLDRELARGIG